MQQGLTFAFAAGDVGGARAVLPVARLAARLGHHVWAMRHGVLHAEGDENWRWEEPAVFSDANFWASHRNVLLYGTSVADPEAFSAAFAAKSVGRTVIHVLDNWSSYSARLRGPNGRICIPSIYAVMDDLAKTEAIADGVPIEILRVTGHPDLAKLSIEADTLRWASASGALDVLFVSEPAQVDSGGRGSPGWRGYDEVEVSAIVAAAIEDAARKLQIPIVLHIAPHPREDADTVLQRWSSLTSQSHFRMKAVDRSQVRSTLISSHAVIGMSSLLLYEAWLLNKPVMSLQPNLRPGHLDTLSKRPGVLFCTSAEHAEPMVTSMLRNCGAEPEVCRDRLKLHASAGQNILDLAIDSMSVAPGVAPSRDYK